MRRRRLRAHTQHVATRARAIVADSATVRSSGAPAASRSELAAAATCSASSALGHSTTAPGPRGAAGSASRRLNSGARYANVLPLPVSAAMTVCCPRSTGGTASACAARVRGARVRRTTQCNKMRVVLRGAVRA